MFFDKIRETYHYSRYKKTAKLIEKNHILLDIGCGKPCDSMEDGSFLNYLGYGIGIDNENCHIKSNFIKGNVLNLPIKSGIFDTVVCLETLEHINPLNLDLALQNIHNVLKENGVLIFSTPNNNFFWKIFWLFWNKSIGRMWREKHETEFKSKEWISLLKKYFTIINIQTYLGIILFVKMVKKSYENGL